MRYEKRFVRMKKYSRVYVEITNVCNKNCSFCLKTTRPKRQMTRNEFDKVTDKLIGVTDYIYLHVLGEPLCHPEVCDFIRLATVKGFKCAITTNGTLLDRCGESIIDAGVYKVNISVHSLEDGTEQEYKRYLNSCIAFADKASKSGVLTVLRLWNKGYDNGKNLDTVTALREFFSDSEWQEGKRGARIRHKLHLEYGERFNWPSMDISPLGDEVFCYGLADHFGILSDGRVIPCCLDREGDITLGNIFEECISDILSGERAVSIKEGFKVNKAQEQLCKRCGYARRFKI